MWTWVLRLLPVLTKGSPLLIAFVVGAAAGWYATDTYHVDKAKAEALAAAVAKAEQGRKSYEKVMAINNELDVALSANRSLRVELDRVRRASAAAGKRARPGDVDRAAVEKCERLLREGAELLAEGGELLQRNALRHDALVRARE